MSLITGVLSLAVLYFFINFFLHNTEFDFQVLLKSKKNGEIWFSITCKILKELWNCLEKSYFYVNAGILITCGTYYLLYLHQLLSHSDEELPDYVLIMVANKKPRDQIATDLSVFLLDQARPFTEWLISTVSSLVKERQPDESLSKKPIHTNPPGSFFIAMFI